MLLLVRTISTFFNNSSVSGEIRENVVRLHILAESNSEIDQQVKLKVRDAVLDQGGVLFNGTVTADEAEKIITPEIGRLKAVAEKVLRDNGCDYTVDVSVGEEYFATRCYDNFTMPAGVYTAVRVNIGSAEGKNWWCVLFPPMCTSYASEWDEEQYVSVGLSGEQYDLITGSNGEYKVKFKLLEIAAEAFGIEY